MGGGVDAVGAPRHDEDAAGGELAPQVPSDALPVGGRGPRTHERDRQAGAGSGGDAVLAAADLVEAAEAEAKDATTERDAREKAALLRALGLEGESKVPPALRAQVRQLEEDQKRRARRARTDVLDRAMIDLLSFYRDVLAAQMGSDVERVNIDLSEALDQVAAATGPEQSLARIAAIEECRTRLRSNAAPLLAIESLMVQLRPQA